MNWPANILKSVARRAGELSPSCKEAVRLESIGLDRALTPVERFGLRFHLVFCKWCRAYGKQIRFLHSAAKKHALDDNQPSPQPVLSSEAHERIKRSLRSAKE
jgi:hypothetical protein